MAIELPHEVVVFLNFIGVPYPDIDEDQVRELAGHVRTFADEVSGTHESATGTIADMGAVYQGQSYRALVASWAQLSSTHMERLDELCKGVATALEITADVIAAVKVAVLAELALLAAAYTAAMAATVATSGASVALSQSLALAARRLVRAMEEMLVAYILAEVLSKAIEPLEEAVSDMIKGAVYGATADLLGVDPGAKDVVLVDPDELRRYAQVLDDHADDIMKHAAEFGEKVAALDFSTPAGLPDISAPPVGGRNDPIGPDTTSLPNRVPEADSPANTPAQRNWIPGSPRGADSPAESITSNPSEGVPGSAAPDRTGTAAGQPAAPGGAPAAGNGPVSAPVPVGAGSATAADNPASTATQPQMAPGIRAESEPARESAPASTEHAATPGDTEPNGRSAASAGSTAVNDAAIVPDAHTPASPGGLAPAGQGRDQQNPWNRPAAQAAGPANRLGNPGPARKSSAGAAPNRPGVPGKASPWGRPATEPVATPTPWTKPGVPAGKPVPESPAAVGGAGGAPPPNGGG
ncbi:hypothetical protein [Nocardia carnea]|uniref:WXG100-like domain-containing protein n=1 Tax=Nocardia carnea TaxID=37328 RepID=UPI0024549D35|nr:hypothetical protein [Nocardia carnea]